MNKTPDLVIAASKRAAYESLERMNALGETLKPQTQLERDTDNAHKRAVREADATRDKFAKEKKGYEELRQFLLDNGISESDISQMERSRNYYHHR